MNMTQEREFVEFCHRMLGLDLYDYQLKDLDERRQIIKNRYKVGHKGREDIMLIHDEVTNMVNG